MPGSIDEADSAAEVRAALTQLHEQDTGLRRQLGAVAASQTHLSRHLSRLDVLRASLGAQAIAVRSIGSEMLSCAAATAGRLSQGVKQLDGEKGRVEATLGVVEQVAELKACVHGVVGSMGAPQDWEAAAAYLARASRIPQDVARGAFAASVVPSIEVPDAPWVTLDEARESLCSLFLREFEHAAAQGDGLKVTRFFKLFPLIGRADVGLDVYGRYVCQGVAGTARAALKDTAAARQDVLFYAGVLTRLFEHIAHIVDSHGALVERHYGSGKMVRVIERLQMEADVQGGIIIDTWSDERAVDRKLTDVKSYPFSFLVQSFLPHGGLAGNARGASPAHGTSAANGTSPALTSDPDDDGVNMKQVDSLLGEIALMLGRWSLYTRFIAAQCKTAEQVPDLVLKSNLHRKVGGKLTTPYNLMTTFFFRRSVEKAFQLDEYPTGLSLSMNKQLQGNAPYIILAVDDVMYIVNAVLDKCLSTWQREIMASVLPTIGRVLASDYIGMIQRKMRDESYPNPVVHGGFPPQDKIIQFIVLVNSLDMTNEYLKRIICGRIVAGQGQAPPSLRDESMAESFPFGRDAAFVASALQTLEITVAAKSTELLNEGIQVLFNQVVKLRLRPVLSDTFRDADYTLTEQELAELAQQTDETETQVLEQVPRRFEHGWEQLMKPIARLMTPRTYSSLLDTTARYLARVLEKRVLSYGGRATAYGAVRLERDFGGIVDSVTKGDYSVRDAFARVSQLLMVANMEDDEWHELEAGQAAASMHWVLSVEERRRARGMVIREGA